MLSFNTACRASLVHWLTKPVIMDMEFSPHHIKGFTNYIKMNNTTISVETKLRKKKNETQVKSQSLNWQWLITSHASWCHREILHVGMIIFFHSKKCTLSTQIKKWSNKSLYLAEFYLSIGFVLAGNLCHLFLQHSRIWSGYHILDVIMSDFVLVEELAVKIFESSHN